MGLTDMYCVWLRVVMTVFKLARNLDDSIFVGDIDNIDPATSSTLHGGMVAVAWVWSQIAQNSSLSSSSLTLTLESQPGPTRTSPPIITARGEDSSASPTGIVVHKQPQ